MKIAIIGTGNIGSTLGIKWAKAGHEINLGVRDLSSFKGQQLLEHDGIKAYPTKEAVTASEVVLLATPAKAAIQVAQSLGDTTGKVLIDAMNIVRGMGPEGFNNTADAVLANTNSTEVVKCFNTTGFENMENPAYAEGVLDAFACGDSTRGKEIARQLCLDAGFANCYDVGGNDKFHLMEQFALFWINLAIFQGEGRNIGFKLLRR